MSPHQQWSLTVFVFSLCSRLVFGHLFCISLQLQRIFTFLAALLLVFLSFTPPQIISAEISHASILSLLCLTVWILLLLLSLLLSLIVVVFLVHAVSHLPFPWLTAASHSAPLNDDLEDKRSSFILLHCKAYTLLDLLWTYIPFTQPLPPACWPALPLCSKIVLHTNLKNKYPHIYAVDTLTFMPSGSSHLLWSNYTYHTSTIGSSQHVVILIIWHIYFRWKHWSQSIIKSQCVMFPHNIEVDPLTVCPRFSL